MKLPLVMPCGAIEGNCQVELGEARRGRESGLSAARREFRSWTPYRCDAENLTLERVSHHIAVAVADTE